MPRTEHSLNVQRHGEQAAWPWVPIIHHKIWVGSELASQNQTDLRDLHVSRRARCRRRHRTPALSQVSGSGSVTAYETGFG
jgi:hypothetical protein